MNVPAITVSGSTPAVDTETKHEKFLRLANARVTRALDAIRLISQLTSRSYEHEKEEAEIIVKHLITGVSDVARAYDLSLVAKIDKSGTTKASLTVFDSQDVLQPVETNRMKIEIAKALELLDDGNYAAAEAMLSDLL